MANKILAIFSFLDKALDKIADGEVRTKAKVELEKAKFMYLMKISWVVGVAILSIYFNFFLKLAFIKGYFDNLTITTSTELVLVVLATKFIFNLDMNTIKETYKFFTKEFWKV